MKFIEKWLEPTIVMAHIIALTISWVLVVVLDICTLFLFNLTNRYTRASEPLVLEFEKRAKDWERKYKN